jgi:hypothetical protein
MKKIVLTLVMVCTIAMVNSQTKEELEAQIAAKKDSIAALTGPIQGRVDALQGQLDALPGWRKGAFGTIGGSLSNFNNWFAQGTPNNSSGNIGITGNAFANLKQEKFFWNNSLNLNLGWVKLDNKDIDTDSEDFEALTDVFQLTSLYGRNISKNFAISALGEYRTTLLNNFNDPGYLSYTLWKGIGVGFDFGLRNNKQEALNFALAQDPATATSFDDLDNQLQSFYTVGLSYSF